MNEQAWITLIVMVWVIVGGIVATMNIGPFPGTRAWQLVLTVLMGPVGLILGALRFFWMGITDPED